MDERFDDVLLNIAGSLGGIEPLFDTIFSFLLRKTDYFHVMQPGDKIGFKAGVAQQLLLRSFAKYEQAASLGAKRAEADAKKKAEKKAAPKKPDAPAPEPPKPKPTPTTTTTTTVAAPASTPLPPTAQPPSDVAEKAVKAAGAKSASHLVEQVGVPYNGGRTERYYWEQTLNDVTINVPVPQGTRARDVVCVISKTHLNLKIKGKEDPLIDSDFPCDARNGQEVWERVRTDESYWNVGDFKGELCVCVYLEKERESWWKSAVHGDAEIDTTQVDSQRDLYDYDNETQGAIRKIMHDQHQKRLGKPTSEESKNEEMLRQAWDAEGSPFKGTPFDPSKINMGGGGGGAGGVPGMGGGGGMPPMPPEPEPEEEDDGGELPDGIVEVDVSDAKYY